MKKFLVAGLALFGLAFAMDTAPFGDQEQIFNSMVATHPTVIEGQTYMAVFQSTKVWLVNPGQTADWRNPTSIIATAWYDPEHNGLDPIKRVTFNGMPLEVFSNRTGPYYGLKQLTSGDYEDWINWYAYFDYSAFPQYVSADAVYGQPRFIVGYPAPYRLNVGSILRVGAVDWSYEMAPVFAGEPNAQYGVMRLYPSRTVGSTYLASFILNPGTVSQSIPADPGLAAMGGGWRAGSLQGYAGASACNEKSLDFAGGKKVLIKACTLVVSPVTLEVIPPR